MIYFYFLEHLMLSLPIYFFSVLYWHVLITDTVVDCLSSLSYILSLDL